jgi:tetratricopeptide (TPR) repeat protein
LYYRVILFLSIYIFSSILPACGGEIYRNRVAQTGQSKSYKEKVAKALEHFEKGKEAYMANNFDIAEIEFRQAIALNSKLAEAHLYLGRTLEIQKRYDEAIAELEIYCRSHYNDPEIYTEIALIYEKQKNFPKSMTYYKYALSAYSDFNNIFHKDLLSTDSEVTSLEQKLKEYPSDNETRIKLFLIYEKKARLSKAIYHIKKILSSLNKDSLLNKDTVYTVEDYKEQGVKSLEKKLIDKALNEFTCALQLDPKAMECYYYMAIAYESFKDYKNSLDCFKLYTNSANSGSETLQGGKSSYGIIDTRGEKASSQ